MSDPLRPDPFICYRRLCAAPPTTLTDGPALVVGTDGVFVAPHGSSVKLPRLVELREASGFASADLHQIAEYSDEPVYALAADGVSPPGQYEEIGYRELYGTIPDEELALVSRATQIVSWDRNTGFCSRCSAVTEPEPDECVKRCPRCGLVQYPRLAPAMIVGVVRDRKLLLAQSPRFRGQFHSILAGFVEPGESAEQCVAREVYEEVGITVGNIRYFGSQPWPFPHSFMLGFTAEYESGELVINPAELVHAGWYGPHELPDVPGEVSISGRIINWFRSEYGYRRQGT